MRSFISSAAAALIALAGYAAPASAQNLDLSEVAAALALPLITDDWDDGGTETEEDIETHIVITNTSSSAIRVGFQVISGDEDDEWTANSFDCIFTGNETTVFEISRYGDEEGQDDGHSEIEFECSDPDGTGDSDPDDLSLERVEVVAAANGIMFAYVMTVDGARVSSNDVLTGSSTVINFADGSAWSVGAIPFQGGDALAQDGDLEFRFDGLEYAQFPSVLTTGFLAPLEEDGDNGNGDEDIEEVETALILFTLDGTIHSAEPPAARVKINFYNDDERKRNAAYEFDCFAIVDLDDIDERIDQNNLGSAFGHLELIPSPILYEDSAHDFLFDGPNVDNVRNVPVHGWIVTQISGSDFDAAWAHQLGQGTFSHVPTVGDTPVLNAQ